MNQFFYNMAKTYSALKQVLFVSNYKVLTMHGEQNKGDPKTPQSAEESLNENAQPGF